MKRKTCLCDSLAYLAKSVFPDCSRSCAHVQKVIAENFSVSALLHMAGDVSRGLLQDSLGPLRQVIGLGEVLNCSLLPGSSANFLVGISLGPKRSEGMPWYQHTSFSTDML